VTANPPTIGPAVAPRVAGWRCVCPRCGRAPLFHGFLTVVDRCACCGLDVSRHDTGDGPAVLLTFFLGIVVVPPVLLVSMLVDWPVWLHALVWGAVVLAVTLATIRPAKAYVLALQYRHRRDDDDEDHGR
jgi:uncharacterized protein (DUF983 family)